MFRFFLLPTLFAALQAAKAVEADVGFYITTGDDEKGKYGIYFIGYYNDTMFRDMESLVGVIPDPKTKGNRVGFTGRSGNGWAVRSNDLKFRFAFQVELVEKPTDGNKFLLSLKNLADDPIGVRADGKQELTTLKKGDEEFHPLSPGMPVSIGQDVLTNAHHGNSRLLISVEHPGRQEL